MTETGGVTTDLRDARVMVTGASIGIGRETAFDFAAAGCRLVLTYHEHADEATAVAERCRELGSPDVLMLRLDLGDEQSARECTLQVERRFGELDILVNNAGIVVWRPFVEQSLQEIEQQIAVNLTGTLRLTWLLLPLVRDTVIVVASTAALHGTSTLAPYCASKWGVRGFVKALAKELPDRRVVSVHPTVTATRMNDFRGMAPEKGAEVVLRVARRELGAESGADVDVREVVPGS
jgi:NAD(P)-dependent dehydrogenase (short-subunit alcohol dehydrogenase family)